MVSTKEKNQTIGFSEGEITPLVKDLTYES